MTSGLSLPFSSSTTFRAASCARGPTPLRGDLHHACASTTGDAGRELMRRLSKVVASAAQSREPARDTWVSAAAQLPGTQGARRAAGITRQLCARVPARHGGARRASSAISAKTVPNTGRNRSARQTCMSSSPQSRPTPSISSQRSRAPGPRIRSSRASRRSGVRIAIRPPTRREAFGFKDGISHPAIEGSGIPGTQSS